jgi:putative phosphoesterase
MKKVGIISDTHAEIADGVMDFLEDVDEIWHAGDVGSFEILDRLRKIGTVRAVYGNIDNHRIRSAIPEKQLFRCEGVLVVMIHIGGYPGRYSAEAKSLIEKFHPKLFISGHSHILKVMYDKKYDLLHINPGAAGKRGFHKHITAIRMKIHQGRMSDLEVLEIERNNK